MSVRVHFQWHFSGTGTGSALGVSPREMLLCLYLMNWPYEILKIIVYVSMRRDLITSRLDSQFYKLVEFCWSIFVKYEVILDNYKYI